ncbi:D-aminoacyl-tRNA deacylase [Kangiella sp. TOML190]|uniref:D-aminoacyl-tRNA deacylase n=1 Tax=Kangiella sp. TOML190 TaxID=2931351 RepID=UPI00203E1BE1|nr:D-aminoacyl-tRNA deacylase [Kangiella sp. TOML190]
MIGLLQRVKHASVTVNKQQIGKIAQGLMVLIGVEKDDTQATADKLLQKLLKYRVFCDAEDKMNLSLTDVKGGLLLVPQFTLAADTNSGLRPSFSSAAPPSQGQELFEYLVKQAKQSYPEVECGKFGADMQVELLNDGPVTFNIKV